MHKLIASILSVFVTTVFTVVGTSSLETKANAPSPVIVLNNVRIEDKIEVVTTTSTVAVPQGARCPQLWQLSIAVGWKVSELKKLDEIIWRESRCEPSAFNAGDPNGGSYGLMQINGFWCKKSRYSELGFLQDLKVLGNCEDLKNPKTNLKSALEIFNYSLSRNGDGWNPWRK